MAVAAQGAATRRAIAQRRHPLPSLRTTSAQPGPPTVYYCTPDFDVPSGGVRVAYRHVDLLNAAGIEARVLHRGNNFSCTWFDHRTLVVGSRETLIGPRDLVVVGELAVSLLDQLPRGFRFVVFNQNQHLTWRLASSERVHRYTHSAKLAAIMTVSEYGAEMLRYLAPGVEVIRTHNSIDPGIFFPDQEHARPRTIAYMPRRGRDEAKQVLGILGNRGALDGWSVSEISGVTERQVGDMLRDASVFLSFAYQEGFGLPAAEAMACGAYAVGFHGHGGREFFRPEWSTAVESGDVLALAKAVAETLDREQDEPGWCASRGAEAARFVAAEYSPPGSARMCWAPTSGC